MTTGSDDALDVALGLLRAPALRGALRVRPLPNGMAELLAIASGSAERARAAAARTGHAQGELLEASRFYVQQILLAEDADAYRVLGVERGADHADIRDHHRLLLRWLHPDRNEGAQWESAFATRVNSAWTQLRSGDAIADYDARPDVIARQVQLPSSQEALPPRPWGLRSTSDAPTGRAGPFAVAGLGLACIALAWLAVQREGELDKRRDHMAEEAAYSSITSPSAADGRASPRHRKPELGVVSAKAPKSPDPQIDLLASSAPPPDALFVAPGAWDVIVQPLAEALSTPSTHAQQASSSSARVGTVVRDSPTIGAARAPMELPIPDPDTTPSRGVASALELRGSTHATSQLPVVAPVPTPAPAPASASIATPATRSAPVASSIASAPSLPGDPLQLMREAEASLGAVTTYLTLAEARSPAFLDAAIRLEAAGIRTNLHARLNARQRRRMVIQSPAWTLGQERASLLAGYSVQARREIQETGLLRLQLVRHGDAWRVAELHLEPAE
ncbi:DnaJ domain-containing protein [Luteimonas sp. MC1825]|uniref:DnaJ domain-containing protein n=1 Tax=Luteimonas sp. MC1825 TaxID=2761107 RepID=UPI00160AA481|nr:DnaJ domain-containing protein [Luteimonas sp. MC1825]MBB6599037.1 DnaJ domain-containing protein [Luteimonas sp. MC1825]QOC89170.1 DnaJ domain-containing protein [Luteimonas sp. MC1825]